MAATQAGGRPALSDDRGARIAALFQTARGMAPAARREFLERECPGDESLRDEVLELLALAGEASRDGFLAPETRRETGRAARPPRRSRAGRAITRSTSSGAPGSSRPSTSRSCSASGSGGAGDRDDQQRGHLRCSTSSTGPSPGRGSCRSSSSTSASILTSGVSVSLLSPARALSVRALRVVEIVNLLAIAAFFTLFQVGEFRRDEWWAIHVDVSRFRGDRSGARRVRPALARPCRSRTRSTSPTR